MGQIKKLMQNLGSASLKVIQNDLIHHTILCNIVLELFIYVN